MIVQHNILAMNANRNVKINTTKSSDNTKKLASGYRINSSSDDAAGLVISEKMRKLIHGLSQGSTNAQDGISMVQTAEGALNEVHDMIQRMNELAIQAANETLSDGDRAALQLEFEHLQDEIDRISETTTFNEKLLFSSGVEEADFNDVSAVRAGFNGEIQNKIDGINNGITVDNTLNQPGTYSLRGMVRAAEPASLTGDGKIDLTSLTGDLVITEKGYTINGTEYSYTGEYRFTGETNHKVTINNQKEMVISLADGVNLDDINIGKSYVTLKSEGVSYVGNVSIDSSGYLYVKGASSTEVNIGNMDNSGNVSLETKVNLSGTFDNNSANLYIRNKGQLNISHGITNTGYISINSGCKLEINGIFTNNSSVSNNGTMNVKGDTYNNSSTTTGLNSTGTMVIEGNLNNTRTAKLSGNFTVKGNMENSGDVNISGGTITVEGNLTNTGTADVSGKLIVKGDMTNKNNLNVNYKGNVSVHNQLINEDSILIDGDGTLALNTSLANTGNIRINTFGTLDGTNASMTNSGVIQVEDYHNIDGSIVGNGTVALNTITLNFTALSDVYVSDTGFEVGGKQYTNNEINRTYRIKGQTSHSGIHDLNITSGNVNVEVLGNPSNTDPVYVGDLNIATGAQINLIGSGRLVADNIIGDNPPISNPRLFKYSNGTIDLATINDTLQITSYGYKEKNDDLKYHIVNGITLKGSISNDGDNSDRDLDIEINSSSKNITISDSSDCIVNSVILNVSNVNIYGDKLVAKEIHNTSAISSTDELYLIGTDQIDVNSISGTLTIGDDYYQNNNSLPKYYNDGPYYFSGDKDSVNIKITSPNEIIVDDYCYVGTVTYDSTAKGSVSGDGKLICKAVKYEKTGIIEGDDMIVLSPNEIDLSKVKDSLIITDSGYIMDNVNYEVNKGEGITLKGTTDKDISIDSERIIDLFGVQSTGNFTVVSPTKGNVQVVGDTSISNFVVQGGSTLNIYGDGPLHMVGESFNMGYIVNDVEEVYQEGEFNNLGEFVNQSNIINEGIINNADDGKFINKGNIENEGIINNLAEFENDRDGIILNDKFIYNVGEFYNKAGATLDNNNVIENRYRLINKGTLDNYNGRIDNYYSVAGMVLGNQPIYIYDTSRTENTLSIQAGAEKDDKIEIDVLQMNARVLGIQKDRVNIRTSEDTTNALVGITFALDRLSKQRSMLGSYQNRLEHTIRNLDNAVENTTSAESGIRDTDMAKEMVAYANNNILSQSAQSMLAQANQMNSGVLRLLS